MYYRTKTYIAGDWTGDIDAIEQLEIWNKNRALDLSFADVHEIKQARDSSLNCSIKKSLKERLDMSNTFVLIVGNSTKNLTAGACCHCPSYNAYTGCCARGNTVDQRSFIEYECEKAYEAYQNGEIKKIIILYNSVYVNKDKCPDILKKAKIHVAMVLSNDFWGNKTWDYYSVLYAFKWY